MKPLFLSLLLIAPLALSVATIAHAAPNADGEEAPAGEAEAITKVSTMIETQVRAAAARDGHAFRDAHRKAHGCVAADFEVLGNLPAELRAGLFAQPSLHKAVIRYSNGSGEAKDDHDGDGRGMAVKVLGVDGERNLSEGDDERTSQDFLMINHPVFFVRTASDYVGFQEAVQAGHVLRWLLNPFRVFHEGLIAKTIQGKKMINPLDAEYFSMTASKLGPQQMKFRAVPCAGSAFRNPSDSADRLRENLTASLASADACFLFQVQRRLDPANEPVEDPTVEWTSPFVTVAKISIARQEPAQGERCEALSFNPWNGLAEHRPLGGISRARRVVYQAISRVRHELNNQRREEPRD